MAKVDAAPPPNEKLLLANVDAAGLKVNGDDEVFADGPCVPNAKPEAVLFVDAVGVEELKFN